MKTIQSGIAECVAEGLAAGMKVSAISRAYGISYGTVTYYVWMLRHPERFAAHRERVRLSGKSKRTERRPPGQPIIRRTSWSDEDVRQLQLLLVQQYSFSEIARMLKRTRNAIAGKASRLKSSTPA